MISDILFRNKNYTPFEYNIDNIWYTAICECNHSNITYWSSIKDIKCKDIKEPKGKTTYGILYNKQNQNTVAMISTNISLENWDWKSIFAHFVKAVHVDMTLFCNQVMYQLDISYDKLISAYNYFQLMSGYSDIYYQNRREKYLISILNNMMNNKVDLTKYAADILSLSPPVSTSVTIFLPSLDYNSPYRNISIYDVILNCNIFDDKSYAITRLFEHGFSYEDINDSIDCCINDNNEEKCNKNKSVMFKLLKKVYKQHKMIKYKVKYFLFILPRDVAKIAYSYIPWWNNVKLGVNQLTLNEVEKFYTYRVHTDARISELMKVVSELNERVNEMANKEK